jgi:hypothetical protein
MATIAVFLALGGTAWANHEEIFSNDIVNDEVKSVDVRDDTLTGGGLTAPDLRADSVGRSELSPQAFYAPDIAPTTSGSAYGIPSNAIQGSEVTDGAITGDDVNETSLKTMDAHETGYSTCDPGNSTFIDCKELAFQLDRPMPVFATWTYGFGTDGGESPSGACKVLIDGASGVGFDLISEDDSDYNLGGLPVAEVFNLGSGTHTLGFQCKEYQGSSNNSDLVIRQLHIAAVELGFD